ncbi:hypothetical protein HA50_26700 [Pantoea cypripedii]|uniref:Uncharacterized protein n=1 Tax=Pantoea cypripedii TaxID=55209 RepID=A0A1X1EMT6_PANCY|nr:hypothetical protein HA50_26700 [Pantoea cypripedii]
MRKIVVVPYDEKWPEMFEAESLLIQILANWMAALLCKNDTHRYSALKANFIECHLQLALIDANDRDRLSSLPESCVHSIGNTQLS